MKKFFLVAALSSALVLGACTSTGGVDVNAIIKDAQAACAFTPAAAGVISLINVSAGATALQIAQEICAAVNNINTIPGGGTKFAKGTEISVVVNGVTIAGVLGK